uniref:Uncharacterized protein n=1 Tax=Arundo donax TaxID=35708 RepID=A0A0A9FQS5_ARUDO
MLPVTGKSLGSAAVAWVDVWIAEHWRQVKKPSSASSGS